MDGDGPLTPERKMANVTLDILRTAEEVERTMRGNRSLDGLLAVVHGLRDLPGRKTLVYFSEGLQVPPWLEDPFRALASEANRAGVSIYSVDVRGLQVAGHLDDARAAARPGRHGQREPAPERRRLARGDARAGPRSSRPWRRPCAWTRRGRSTTSRRRPGGS